MADVTPSTSIRSESQTKSRVAWSRRKSGLVGEDPALGWNLHARFQFHGAGALHETEDLVKHANVAQKDRRGSCGWPECGPCALPHRALDHGMVSDHHHAGGGASDNQQFGGLK